MISCDCRRHGKLYGLENCPKCSLEEYINKEVEHRTLYLHDYIIRLRKIINDLTNGKDKEEET